MSTTPSTPPPTTTTFTSTTPNTTPGVHTSPSSSPKPKEKWTTRVGTLVKRRSTGRRSSLSLSNTNTNANTNTHTPGDVSDSASEKEKVSLVDNLVRKASRRLSFTRTSSTTDSSIQPNPKKRPSIDLQRSVTVDVDLPTTTSTSSLSLEPAHQINGGVKHGSLAMLSVDVPSPIAESPLREADAVMRDTVAAGTEGGRGRFISMSSIKPEIDVAPPIPASVDEDIKDGEDKAEEKELITSVPVPTIAIHAEEAITPPALAIPFIIPYVAPVEEDTYNPEFLDNDAVDHDFEGSMVIVDHPNDEEISPVSVPVPIITAPALTTPTPQPPVTDIQELEKPVSIPVATHHEVAEDSQAPSVSPLPKPSSSSELYPPTSIVPQVDEKSTSKSSPTPRAHSPTPTPTPTSLPPHSTHSTLKLTSTIIATSIGIALTTYTLIRTGIIPSSSIPWFSGTSTPSTALPATSMISSHSASGSGLIMKYIPNLSLSFLSSFPFSFSSSSFSPNTAQNPNPNGAWGEGIAIAADAASLVVDAAVDAAVGGGGIIGVGGLGGAGAGAGLGGGVPTGAVAGTGLLAVLGAGLAKFGSVFWGPWRAQRRGS